MVEVPDVRELMVSVSGTEERQEVMYDRGRRMGEDWAGVSGVAEVVGLPMTSRDWSGNGSSEE